MHCQTVAVAVEALVGERMRDGAVLRDETEHVGRAFEQSRERGEVCGVEELGQGVGFRQLGGVVLLCGARWGWHGDILYARVVFLCVHRWLVVALLVDPAKNPVIQLKRRAIRWRSNRFWNREVFHSSEFVPSWSSL